MSDIFDAYGLPESCEITSPPTMTYNSVAWAAGDNGRNWQPYLMGKYYWPGGLSKENTFTLETCISLYRSLGFEQISDKDLDYEQGIERLAIYVDDTNRVSHVARQIADEFIAKYPERADLKQARGKWTSKIEDKEDICHKYANDIEGSLGYIVVVMTRPSQE